MAFDLNQEPVERFCDGEPIILTKFSIRAYVAEIRVQVPEKCWPFGSVCDYKDFSTKTDAAPSLELPLFSEKIPGNHEAFDDVPENTEAPDSFEVEIAVGIVDGSETPAAFEVEIANGIVDGSETPAVEVEIANGIMDGSETPAVFEVEIPKGNEAGSESPTELNGSTESPNEARFETAEETATFNADPGMPLPKPKKRKFRLLSDILKDLAGPSAEAYVSFNGTIAGNVNSKFTVDTEDEADDITLGSFLRKQKGFKTDEPRLDVVQWSTPPGPEGSQTAKKRKVSWAEPLSKVAKEKQATKPFFWGVPLVQGKRTAVKWLGRPVKPDTGSMGGQSQAEVSGTKDAGEDGAAKDGEAIKCRKNKNPAEHTIPHATNRYMRGG